MLKNIIIIILLIIGLGIIYNTYNNYKNNPEQVNKGIVKACIVDMQNNKELICD